MSQGRTLVNDEGEARVKLAWLDVLRAFAVLLVLSSHIFFELSINLGHMWYPAKLVENWIYKPLGITQYGGFLGVSIFFLISGFIITKVACRENWRVFALRRILRIYPPLFVSLLLVLLSDHLFGFPTFQFALSFSNFMKNALIINYWETHQHIMLAVTWTLVIEVTFYAFVLICKKMLTTRNPESFLILLFLLVVVQVLTSRLFGGDYFLFSVSANYLPILGIGASFAIVEIKKSWSTSLYLWIPTYFATFIFATKNFYPNFLKSGDSYPMSLVYAIFIFAILYGKNRSWHTHFLIKYVAKWSYSIYLVHMLIATLIVTRFLKMTGFTAAIAIALAFIGLFAFLYERVIERPSRRIGDIVLKKYR